jgi:hypothetical protein
MGSRVLVYRRGVNPLDALPVALIWPSGVRMADPELQPLRRTVAASAAGGFDLFRTLGRVLDEALGTYPSRPLRPDGPSSLYDPVFLGLTHKKFFDLWAARVVAALATRGLTGVPQGHWARPSPAVARWKFCRGRIVRHPTPRRGSPNYA